MRQGQDEEWKARRGERTGSNTIEGAAKRIRPKVMTVMTMLIGLLPVLWSSGTGADVMRRIAAPMIGGLVSSFILELAIYPAIYAMWKRRALRSPTS